MIWQEKRTIPRHAIELPVKYRVLSKSKEEKSRPLEDQVYKTKNISESGILFLSSEYFKIGTLLELTLPLRDKVFTMEGRVVHSSQDSATRLFRTGIYFPSASSVFKVKLIDQIHQIDEYRRSISIKESRPISEEEAAHLWIKEHSVEFAEFYKY
ncbi:MAG: hypothetical protein A3C35_00885 [Omnitrophica bacterium RIFCSPHIGHO2_02_FULL_46_11]|nr:MAG: hypothetical protein A3C35_00885 [Omnitrophica bacterium RIFCSPHIGHO2_02_FULL_46_11]OGW86804.1 MAG: hypothetical protein A3A81_04045 [Omnitrophica bacterium RIFCSPLOWO2_01_FULL_45_10b]